MKSHESSQLELALCIYKDAFAKCAAAQPSLRDEMTISSRIKDEGLSFLTITLPQFGKDLQKALSSGVIDSTLFRSFRKSGSIPAFLQGMISRIFDRETGRILDETVLDISCIEGVRQIAFAFKKLEINCTRNRVQLALDRFKQTELDLIEAEIQDRDVQNFLYVSTVLWDCLFDIDIRQLVPKHGPGATAEGVSGNQKYLWRYWHERLEPYFPFLDNAYPVDAYQSKELKNVAFVPEDREIPVKVTCVPKDQGGPRVITIGPCCMQYAQQAVMEPLVWVLEHSELSAGHVNFTNQQINRDLAMSSSASEEFATLDLTDASNRVINDLSMRMFDCNPDLQDAVKACRSTHAKMPDGSIIGPLRMFASMGSALCFPVESMYFYTICVAALLEVQNLPVTRRNVKTASRLVYVYGDDIIVPSRFAAFVVGHLQKYHCKVNMSKSFWTGKFRESCGMDAYNGVEVTPTYIRKLRPLNKQQASEVISWVKTANQFAKRGYHLTSSHMFNVCEKILGIFPTVDEFSPALGRIRQHQYFTSPQKTRWNKDTHASEIKAWVAEPVRCTDKLGGYGALTKSLLLLARKKDFDPLAQLGESVSSASLQNDDGTWPDAPEVEHLQRSARHGAVTLKRRWVLAQ